MKCLPAILVSIALLIVQPSSGQTARIQFDTLPRVLDLNTLPLKEEIRCIAYLFNDHYRVFDSLQNMYVNLYVDTNWYWRDKMHYDGLSDKLYQSIRGISIRKQAEFIKNYYKDFVISYYDMKGRLLHVKFYTPDVSERMAPTLDNIDILCSSMRIPLKWDVVKDQFQTVFFCVEPRERKRFHYIFLWFLQQLQLMNKKWVDWDMYYFSCSGHPQLHQTFRLNNE